jgi:hypothetical protein
MNRVWNVSSTLCDYGVIIEGPLGGLVLTPAQWGELRANVEMILRMNDRRLYLPEDIAAVPEPKD